MDHTVKDVKGKRRVGSKPKRGVLKGMDKQGLIRLCSSEVDL